MTPRPEPPRLPPACARAYALVKPLGEGAYGSVWLATQRALDRPVALKLLKDAQFADEAQVARFRAEARITAALDHPNIVRVYDHDVEDGVPWIAYEHVQGDSLRAHLARGPMAWAAALRIAAELAAALQHAHDAGVLHRDVKPENVLVADGRHRLTDFGIARWTASSEVRTATGVILGTPTYVAPEQIRGQPFGPAADLYALGVLTHELIAGAPPFATDALATLLADHVHRPPPPLSTLVSGVPRPVEDLVLRLLAKQPDDRFPSAAAVVAACEAAQAAPSPRSARSSSATRRVGRAVASQTSAVSGQFATAAIAPSPTPRRALALACGAAAAVLALLTARALHRDPPPPPAAATAPAIAPLDAPGLIAAVKALDAYLEPLFAPLRSSGDILGDTITHATPLTQDARRREAASTLPARLRDQSAALLDRLPATLAPLAGPQMSAAAALPLVWNASWALEQALYFRLESQVDRALDALPDGAGGQLGWGKAYLACSVTRIRGGFLIGKSRAVYDERAEVLGGASLAELLKRRAAGESADAQVDAELAVRVQLYHCLGRHNRGAQAREQKEACRALIAHPVDRGPDPWVQAVDADIHRYLSVWLTSDGSAHQQRP